MTVAAAASRDRDRGQRGRRRDAVQVDREERRRLQHLHVGVRRIRDDDVERVERVRRRARVRDPLQAGIAGRAGAGDVVGRAADVRLLAGDDRAVQRALAERAAPIDVSLFKSRSSSKHSFEARPKRAVARPPSMMLSVKTMRAP